MAKNRQHGKCHAALLLNFFVIYYKRNIKHFFIKHIQLYQNPRKLEKLDTIVIVIGYVWSFNEYKL